MSLEILKELHKKAYLFFEEEVKKEDSNFGLIYDNSKDKNICSIAGTGFYLTSLLIGVENNYIERDKALENTKKTLKTLIKLPHFKGFLAHFIDARDNSLYHNSEYSTIDTMLLLNGVITISSYFNEDEEVKFLSTSLLDRIDFKSFITKKEEKTYFYMSYNPNKYGAYANGKEGYISLWDMTAEQIMMYIIAANYLDIDISRELYNSFERSNGTYENISFTHSPLNTLFVYQYPLAWLYNNTLTDINNFSWWDNCTKACRAQKIYASKNKDKFLLNDDLFGFSASESKNGYKVYCLPPNDKDFFNVDGTLCAHGFIGSLPFIPDSSINCIKYIYNNYPNYQGKYGFYDAFNLKENWYSSSYYSIDKGLELLMLDNYLNNNIFKYYSNSKYIKTGLERLGFKWQP
ncbi:MAG: hypothetical protein LBV58_00210 [Acholeplasmatales bacterium]|jgi:hypothetical protein|nr:hypothetical protein [Acholeplasmatales bacterium]